MATGRRSADGMSTHACWGPGCQRPSRSRAATKCARRTARWPTRGRRSMTDTLCICPCPVPLAAMCDTATDYNMYGNVAERSLEDNICFYPAHGGSLCCRSICSKGVAVRNCWEHVRDFKVHAKSLYSSLIPTRCCGSCPLRGELCFWHLEHMSTSGHGRHSLGCHPGHWEKRRSIACHLSRSCAALRHGSSVHSATVACIASSHRLFQRRR